ncbi:MAG: radical SAM protein [Deltaproteobacteria bacterium]|nr:radical SAM protein [Deltaproteobacteria bacterium]
MLYLAGCGLRCRFCQRGGLQDPVKIKGQPLDRTLWSKLDIPGARSLSFIGGNPDESLYAVLKFLKKAPDDWNLPIVWNCHGYASSSTLQLLEGIVDVYVPDFKYGQEDCGRRFSLAPHYPQTAQRAISAMVEQKVPVYVRILVLPGHFKCCHQPVLNFLASLDQENLFVSIRGQYCPDWMISCKDGELNRRVTFEEVDAVRRLADQLGLNLVA